MSTPSYPPRPHRSAAQRSRAALPPDVRRALSGEPADEQAALHDAWAQLGDHPSFEPADADFARLGAAMWAELEAAAAEPLRGDGPRTEPRSEPRYGAARAADRAAARPAGRRTLARTFAVVLPLLALAAVALALYLRPTVLTAPYGETVAVELADGTVVELNSGAELRVGRGFGEAARPVALRGEAFFAVAHDPARPFVVETFNAEITVLGTRFNVRAWPEEPAAATDVVLAEGRVRLTPAAAPSAAVTLAPGEAARVVDAARAPEAPAVVDVQGALAWRDGAFVFSGTKPLGAVLDEVERRFDVRIRVADPDVRHDVLALRIGRPASAETVLRDLCAAYDAYAYRTIEGGFELYRRD